MAELQDPAYLQEGCITAQGDRQVLSSLVCGEGVAFGIGGELEVTQRGAGANMSVDVASGNAFVEGTEVAWQGMYHVSSDGTKNLTITAADPTDDRIDLIIARVRDSTYSGANDDWLLAVVTGTPSPAPVAPALPDNSYILASVLVPNGATSIVNADITDERSAYEDCAAARSSYVQNLIADFTPTTGTGTQVAFTDDGDHTSDWSLVSNGWVYNGNQESLFLVTCMIPWVANATGTRRVEVLVNATTPSLLSVEGPGQATNPTVQVASGILRLIPGDEVTFFVRQSSGISLAVDSTNAAGQANINMARVATV